MISDDEILAAQNIREMIIGCASILSEGDPTNNIELRNWIQITRMKNDPAFPNINKYIAYNMSAIFKAIHIINDTPAGKGINRL